MRNLRFGVILLLLAAVHSTPFDYVTQLPTDSDDDVLREVLDDGYLLDEFTHRVLTTSSPRIHTTIQASQQPTSDPNNIEIEGSVDINAEPSATTTVQVGDTHVTNATGSENSTTAEEVGDASSVSTTSERPGLSSSVPPKASPTPVFTTKTNGVEDLSENLMGKGSYGSGSGFGSGDMQDFVAIAGETTTLNTSESTSSSPSTTSSSFPPGENSDLESEVVSVTESGKESNAESESDKTSDKDSDEASDKESGTEPGTRSGSKQSRVLDAVIKGVETQPRGHVDKVILNDQKPNPESHYQTPGWIIILAFIVGLAALIMLCVAIATRDKWNGPRKTSKSESKKTGSLDQEREQEMTTFVRKESPRENGKAGEYTVIPLDELPENCSSH